MIHTDNRSGILSVSTSFAKTNFIKKVNRCAVDKPIYNMNVPELKKSIELKEKEYREAIKARKVFWEVKRIMEQKRAMEKQLSQNNCKS